MTKLVYIAGSSHSGTTMLDMLMSSHSSVCGLGESVMLINDKTRPKYLDEQRNVHCSCGAKLTECSLWGKYLEYLQDNPEASFSERYNKLRNDLMNLYGQDVIISDSSKYLKNLKELNEVYLSSADVPLNKEDLVVLHIVKDVRSFVTSIRRNRKLTLRDTLKKFRSWCSSNNSIRKYAQDNKLRYLLVSYDQLCFNTAHEMERICDFMGIPYQSSMADLGAAEGHIGVGNGMRNDTTKSARIVYDNRWFYEDFVHLLYLLMPKVRAFNEDILKQAK